MENVLLAILWFYLFLAAYFVVKESIFHCRKKKIVPGAMYEDISSGGIIEEVVDYDRKTMNVTYKHFSTKERQFRPVMQSMNDREFVKLHRRVNFPYCKEKKFGRK